MSTPFKYATEVHPNEFDNSDHYYDRVKNAQIHPMVKYFMALSNERIIERYCHLHPAVDKGKLTEMLKYQTEYFAWTGADLFPVANEHGIRNMVLIETNSCPSGSKSMPLFDETEDRGSYLRLMKEAFLPRLEDRELPEGALAVFYDKNPMETLGYARALADLTNETVYISEYYKDEDNPAIKFIDGIMQIRNHSEKWVPIRAAFKYVTQKPWNRIPINSKTYIFNPIVCCLAGGRNKLVAAKAYDFLNGELSGTDLEIRTPETVLDVSKNEVKYWIDRFGGFGVIKVPYSNAGQGVYTITSEQELEEFLSIDFDYDVFIVQSLIGNAAWSSLGKYGRLYHIGTVPSKRNTFFVADIRMMIMSTSDGFRPLATYARRSRIPLRDTLDEGASSWDMLGTNLSIKKEEGWMTDTDRLLLMDQRDFNKLGIGIDDLIEGYIQTVLAAISIDKMAKLLIDSSGDINIELFRSLDPDESLIQEIIKGN